MKTLLWYLNVIAKFLLIVLWLFTIRLLFTDSIDKFILIIPTIMLTFIYITFKGD